MDYTERLQTGRNDDCPCGSKKKYKKCHLAADEAAQTDAMAKVQAAAEAKMKAEAKEGDDKPEHVPQHQHPHKHDKATQMRPPTFANVQKQVSAPRKTGGGA